MLKDDGITPSARAKVPCLACGRIIRRVTVARYYSPSASFTNPSMSSVPSPIASMTESH